MITSARNPKIQWVKTLQTQARARREASVFVVEGVRLCEEALTAGWKAQLVLYTDELSPRGWTVVQEFASQGAQVERVTPQVLQAASDIETPQGILVVLPERGLPSPNDPDFVFIPDCVRDPGNLGTMLRTARAAGVQDVLIPPGTVDVYSPKVLRGAMGAHFVLPIHTMTWQEIDDYLVIKRKEHLHVYLADVRGEHLYSQVDFRSPLALIIGGEAEGAGEQAHRLAEARLVIPMPGGSESLNAAIASAILMFEVVRQRNPNR